MRRVLVLAAIVTAGVLSQGAMWLGCAPPPAGPRAATLEKVKDNLYIVIGGGGNTAVLVTDTGVVLVDTKLAGWGPAILQQIRAISDKPVTTIINTHTHGDHVGSNAFFDTVLQIVAHENTKRHMEELAGAQGVDTAGFLPTRTFADRMSIGSGPSQIDLYYLGAGHTNGDAVVVFPAFRTLHIGDLFADKSPPIIDVLHGGSGVAFPDTLATIHDRVKDVDVIITGHDALMTWPDLQEYAEFNRDFLTWATAQMKAGTSSSDAADAFRIPDRYKGYRSQRARVKTNIDAIYEELSKPPVPPHRWWGGVR